MTMQRLKQQAARNRSDRWSPLPHKPARRRRATPKLATLSRWPALTRMFRGLFQRATKKSAPDRLRDQAEYENGRKCRSVKHRGADRCKIRPVAGVGGRPALEGKARIALLFFVPPFGTPSHGLHSNCHLIDGRSQVNKALSVLMPCKSDMI
jgi:hypothetical protein